MGPPLYFSHPACLGHDTGEHPERPARIHAIEAELARRGWLGYERREAPAAPLDAVTAVHTEAYVDAVPVMDVPVEDEDPADAVLVEGVPRRHRDVVEKAEARRRVAARVMTGWARSAEGCPSLVLFPPPRTGSSG